MRALSIPFSYKKKLGSVGIILIEDIAEIFEIHDIDAEIISASVT